MEKIKESLDKFLPFGETLRPILTHPSINDTERRELLRSKGVFLNSTDENSSYPFLLTSLLNPSHFEYLKEQLKSKEDRDKTVTRTLRWDSDDTLIEAIPDNLDIQELVKTNFSKYELNGNPNFKMVDKDPNKIALDFKCETNNFNNAWFRGKSEFKGQVYLEKVVIEDKKTKNKKVELRITHTSPETMDIAEKVTKKLEKEFKNNGQINTNTKFDRILFKDFTNEERIKFFLNMTKGNDVFDFKKATYLDIGPDKTEDLPDNINWLELAKVRDLNINGEDLHEIHFIKDVSLHKYMELAQMEVLYMFSIPSAEGECRIKFGFQNYFTKRLGNIEFTVDISKIILKDEYSKVPQSSVRTKLLKEFEIYKAKNFDSIKG